MIDQIESNACQSDAVIATGFFHHAVIGIGTAIMNELGYFFDFATGQIGKPGSYPLKNAQSQHIVAKAKLTGIQAKFI